MIPQTHPKATIDEERPRIDAAIARVLDSGRYILGEEVSAFETACAAYVGVAHGVGVANGTDALELALRAVGVRAGDRVATVSHTASATLSAIRALDAQPVYVEIDPATYLMDLDHLAVLAGAGALRAVVAVHLYGALVPPEPLLALCRRYDLPLIEDCAQAHGASANGQRAGSFGVAAAFSFYPTKNLGALGDGGLVVTDDAELAARLRLLREYGWAERFVSAQAGTNSRLDSLQAAILGVLLERLDARNARRRAIAARYDQGLAGLPVVTPRAPAGQTPVYHQYVIRTPRREQLVAHLAAHGIGTAVHYPVPAHRQPAFAQPGVQLPVTDAAAREILSLPIYPQLAPTAVDKIVAAIRQFYTA